MLGEVRSRSGRPVAGDFRGSSPPLVVNSTNGHVFALKDGDIPVDQTGNEVNVMDYMTSAQVDDVLAGTKLVDVASAFNDAIDELNAARGGRLIVPSYDYSVSTVTLKSYVHLVGEDRAEMEAGGYNKGAVLHQHGTTGDVIATAEYPTMTYGCGIHNIGIYGNASATSGRGVYWSQGMFWYSMTNCLVRRCAGVGVFVGGQVGAIRGNFIGYNALYGVASFTFYKGQMEVYGTDHFIEQNEIHGIYDPATFDGAALSNASLYAVSCLVQSVACFFSRNVFEIADQGLVLISQHVDKTGGSGRADPYYPAYCAANTFVQNRSDRNLGHGSQLIATNSTSGPFLNSFIGCVSLHNGRNADNTYDGFREQATGAVYPYANSFVGCVVMDTDGAANNVKYGFNPATAVALQATINRSVYSGNRAHWNSYTTAAFNGVQYEQIRTEYENGLVSSNATQGVGYATGAGGTQTQATNKATTVVLNKVCGTITLNNANLAADTTVAFTLTNSAIAATDLVYIQHDSVGTMGAYSFGVTPAAGSALISVHNNTPGALAEAIVLRFAVIKGVVA